MAIRVNYDGKYFINVDRDDIAAAGCVALQDVDAFGFRTHAHHP
jgi:hypothetical protein